MTIMATVKTESDNNNEVVEPSPRPPRHTQCRLCPGGETIHSVMEWRQHLVSVEHQRLVRSECVQWDATKRESAAVLYFQSPVNSLSALNNLRKWVKLVRELVLPLENSHLLAIVLFDKKETVDEILKFLCQNPHGLIFRMNLKLERIRRATAYLDAEWSELFICNNPPPPSIDAQTRFPQPPAPAYHVPQTQSQSPMDLSYILEEMSKTCPSLQFEDLMKLEKHHTELLTKISMAKGWPLHFDAVTIDLPTRPGSKKAKGKFFYNVTLNGKIYNTSKYTRKNIVVAKSLAARYCLLQLMKRGCIPPITDFKDICVPVEDYLMLSPIKRLKKLVKRHNWSMTPFKIYLDRQGPPRQVFLETTVNGVLYKSDVPGENKAEGIRNAAQYCIDRLKALESQAETVSETNSTNNHNDEVEVIVS